MSKIDSHKVSCPNCNQGQEVTVWDSLNVSLDPDLRETLFSGRINVFKCAHCDYEAFINHPLLYHDMQREYCVQYYPPEVLEEDNFLKMFTRDGKIEVTGMFDQHYLKEPHIVFNINEMIFYIEFRDRLFAMAERISS